MENQNASTKTIIIMLVIVGLWLSGLTGYFIGAKTVKQAQAVQPALAFRVPATLAAIGAPGSAAQPAGDAALPVPVKSLIGKDLTGWKATKGEWKIDAEGNLTNSATPEQYARIETSDSYGDYTLTGKLLIDSVRYGEIQVRGATYGLEYPEMGTWGTFEIVSRGPELKVLLNGQPAKIEPGAKPTEARSPIAFFVMKGGVMKLRELNIKVQ